MKKVINKIMFSGGGVKGVAYIGIVKYLEELKQNNNVILDIQEICGVSIGSFFGLLYAIGYTYEELYNEIMVAKLDEMQDFRIKNFFTKYGMDNGKLVNSWIESLLVKKGLHKDTTLRDIWNKYGINFRVVVTNVNKYNIEIFDYVKNPNLRVIKAVRMSTSIPFVFCAEKYNDNIYVDGGVLNNFPIKIYDENLDNVLGCKLVTNGEFMEDNMRYDINCFDEYLIHLLSCFFGNKERDTTLSYKYIEHTICIHAYKITHPVNFSLTQDEKEILINMGYTSAVKFFHNKISVTNSVTNPDTNSDTNLDTNSVTNSDTNSDTNPDTNPVTNIQETNDDKLSID